MHRWHGLAVIVAGGRGLGRLSQGPEELAACPVPPPASLLDWSAAKRPGASGVLHPKKTVGESGFAVFRAPSTCVTPSAANSGGTVP